MFVILQKGLWRRLRVMSFPRAVCEILSVSLLGSRSVYPLMKNNSGTDEAVSAKATASLCSKHNYRQNFPGTFIFIVRIELFRTDSQINYELLPENVC